MGARSGAVGKDEGANCGKRRLAQRCKEGSERGQGKGGGMLPWVPGVPDPSVPGSRPLCTWVSGPLGPRVPGSLGLRVPGSPSPSVLRPLGPWVSGSLGLPVSGFSGPWVPGSPGGLAPLRASERQRRGRKVRCAAGWADVNTERGDALATIDALQGAKHGSWGSQGRRHGSWICKAKGNGSKRRRCGTNFFPTANAKRANNTLCAPQHSVLPASR